MNFANPSDPPSTSGRFAALDADGTSFWMGTLAGLLARYDIASGQRLDRWTAGLGLGGIAVYNPSAPPAQGPGSGGGSNTTQSTSGSSTVDATLGAQTFAMASSVPSLDMPALEVAHGRLLTSGGSLRLDTGLQVSCPAAGPKCTANVTLTVAGAGCARGRGVGHARRDAEHQDRARREGQARRPAEQEGRCPHPRAPCRHDRSPREHPRGQSTGGRQEDQRARPDAPLALT